MLGLPGLAKRDRMGAEMGEEESNTGVWEGRMCALSVQRSGTRDSVLGDAWLKGVVAVFDVGGEFCFVFWSEGRGCTGYRGSRANVGQIMR